MGEEASRGRSPGPRGKSKCHWGTPGVTITPVWVQGWDTPFCEGKAQVSCAGLGGGGSGQSSWMDWDWTLVSGKWGKRVPPQEGAPTRLQRQADLGGGPHLGEGDLGSLPAARGPTCPKSTSLPGEAPGDSGRGEESFGDPKQPPCELVCADPQPPSWPAPSLPPAHARKPEPWGTQSASVPPVMVSGARAGQ